MKPLSEQDYYETLDITRAAAPEEIERAYRLACSTYAPDSLAGYPVFEEGDVELLRERIEIAYRTLADPTARAAYDRELGGGREAAPALNGTAAAGVVEETFAASNESVETPVLEPLDALDELEESEGEWSGARLRRTRLRQGVEIEEIAETTKVNPTYLRFIEEERFDGLPAAVYVRGFVTGIAGCLGLDAKRVASSYVERYEERDGRGRRRLFSRK
jgi:flagellar biosynthesis protein FlhG